MEKIKTKEEISKDEKIALVNVFYKNFNYKMRYTDIFIWFSDVELESYDKQKFNGSLLWKDYINEGRK